MKLKDALKIQLLKISHKEKILKTAKLGEKVTNKGTKVKIQQISCQKQRKGEAGKHF